MYEDYDKDELDDVAKAYVNGMEDAMKSIDKICEEQNAALRKRIKSYLTDEINEYIMRTIDSQTD